MKKQNLLFVLLFLVGVISCKKDLDPVSIPKNDNITIDEAKSWFDDVMKSAKLSGNDVERQVYWKYAYESKMDKKKKNALVIVPISQVRRGKILGIQQLWVYKNKNKENTMRIVEFLYDTNIPKEQLGNYSFKNFTGAMLIREWNDDILGGIAYKNGNPVAGLMDIGEIIDGKKQPVKKPKNGRASASDCFTIEKCYNGSTYAMGNTYYWTVCYDSLECIWNFAYDQDQQPPGYGDGYGDSGGAATGSTGDIITYYKRLSVHNSPCDGFNQAISAQSAENKEMNGFITTDNKIIVMPNDKNSQKEVHYVLGEITYDLIGRPLINVTQINGVWNAIIYYYSGSNYLASTSQASYDIKAFFHTHPIEPGTIGWDQPSDNDKQSASNFPELSHYIIHDNGIIKFNGNGETNRKNNWKNDCGGTNNFVN